MTDFGCDWICDVCGTFLNDQPGFSAGDTWTCAECGSLNDVSTDNILEELPEDYVGSYQYYADEEKRRRDDEEDDFELGIID